MQKQKMVEWLAEGSISIPNILMSRYARLGINDEEYILLLHVYTFLSGGNSFPTPDEISSRMSCDSSKCMEILRSLMQKGFITINETNDSYGVINESYSLTPLWEKLTTLLFEEEKRKEKDKLQETESNLYNLFENEFGRPLSPMEVESLSMWIDQDQHNPILIKAALRESVMCGKLNFRYIDRILFEWKKNGIKTIEQAHQYGKRFRKTKGQAQRSEQKQEDHVSVPFYNWLES